MDIDSLCYNSITAVPTNFKIMSDLTAGQIMSMTDEELVMDLVDSGDITLCEKCRVPLQKSVTGYHIITDNRLEKRHC